MLGATNRYWRSAYLVACSKAIIRAANVRSWTCKTGQPYLKHVVKREPVAFRSLAS